MKKHILRRKYDQATLKAADLHPVLRRVYAARNIHSVSELQHSLSLLFAPDQLLDIDKAVSLLTEAVVDRRKILIVADFDVDGATSCSLAITALKHMGATHVDYIVPNRFEFGYGLSPEISAVAAGRDPHLIITVDNGIASNEGVLMAKARGIKVLITDHHLPGKILPDADAIVNPNQPGDLFPSKHLAGVGVIFYVMLALRAALRRLGWFSQCGIAEPNMAELLDFVAVGTVADLVPLDHNNRILVAQGLARIRSGACVPGIKALLEIARRPLARASAADIAFVIGPRLNAAGRLEDMSLGIECLISRDMNNARAMAARLDELNHTRRAIEAGMESDALDELSRLDLSISENDPLFSLCLFNEAWHQGVIGILASRVKERTNRPVIAFAAGGQHELKGSARSVPGFHIRDALDTVFSRHPGIVKRFGGHAMAAGLTICRDRYAEFAMAFEEEVRCHLTVDDLHGVIHSDGELGAHELNLEVADILWCGGPWGQGFPEPLFDGVFKVASSRTVGQNHVKYKLCTEDQQCVIDGIAFNAMDKWGLQTDNDVHVAYRLHSNEFRQQREAQLVIEYMEAVGAGCH